MKIIVTGASGFIGKNFLRHFEEHDAVGLCYSKQRPGLISLDLRDRAKLEGLLESSEPDVVIHCAARPTVDWCESNPGEARALNVEPTVTVARECARLGATLVFLSSDYVFDGTAGPYYESDNTNPINVYGRLKLEAEELVRELLNDHIIVRTTNVYGYDLESKNFLMPILPRLARGEQARVPSDEYGNPTLVSDLCSVVGELIERAARGTFHIVGPDLVNRVEWARAAAEVFGVDPELVVGVTTDELGQPAPRPRRSGLVSERMSSHTSQRLLDLKDGLRAMREDWRTRQCPLLPGVNRIVIICAMSNPVATFWEGRPVLVTGCTGLLGSWLAGVLVERGARVIGLVRDWVPESELFRAGTINRMVVARGDVTDQAELERVLGEYEIDTVFHLAAQTIVGIANRNPVSTFETNIGGTWSVIEACRRSPAVRRYLVASSDKAYGTHDDLPYSEDAPLQGRHPYDVSKSCSVLLAQSYAATYGLPVCVTRCGNLYGGGDLNWSRLVPGTIRAALRGERPLVRSDGSYIRDYFYVEDGVHAYLTLAEQLASNRELAGEAFNFSNEIQVTVLELVREILRIAGKADLEPQVLGEAQNEIKHQYLDVTKARQMLAWRPQFELATGLSRTVEWYRRFLMPTDSTGSNIDLFLIASE